MAVLVKNQILGFEGCIVEESISANETLSLWVTFFRRFEGTSDLVFKSLMTLSSLEHQSSRVI